MVRSPGPAPAAQARASNFRLTPIQLADLANHRKLRFEETSTQGGGRLDHVNRELRQPSCRCAARRRRQDCEYRPQPARMPPGSASCRPGSTRPGASPRSTWLSTSSPSGQVLGEGDRKDAAQHSATRCGGRRSATWMRYGLLRWWHLLGAPRFGSVWSLQNHYPRSREHFLTISARRYSYLFGGLGFTRPSLRLRLDAS